MLQFGVTVWYLQFGVTVWLCLKNRDVTFDILFVKSTIIQTYNRHDNIVDNHRVTKNVR